jgi:hypothetical protein
VLTRCFHTCVVTTALKIFQHQNQHHGFSRIRQSLWPQ